MLAKPQGPDQRLPRMMKNLFRRISVEGDSMMHQFMSPIEYTRLGWRIVVGLFWVGLFSLNAAAEDPGSRRKHSNDHWEFLDSGIIRVGVDKSRGTCIGFFGEGGVERNVLNHYDHGTTRSQEMPAVFVDAEFKHLVYWEL